MGGNDRIWEEISEKYLFKEGKLMMVVDILSRCNNRYRAKSEWQYYGGSGKGRVWWTKWRQQHAVLKMAVPELLGLL